mmetsp:Transcript_77333/g.185269  ORF Transcript_77333/g.185269 Transcript_77333/m.185269 type:complete len:238 (-) Transcript_77333:394-1107(-)
MSTPCASKSMGGKKARDISAEVNTLTFNVSSCHFINTGAVANTSSWMLGESSLPICGRRRHSSASAHIKLVISKLWHSSTPCEATLTNTAKRELRKNDNEEQDQAMMVQQFAGMLLSRFCKSRSANSSAKSTILETTGWRAKDFCPFPCLLVQARASRCKAVERFTAFILSIFSSARARSFAAASAFGALAASTICWFRRFCMASIWAAVGDINVGPTGARSGAMGDTGAVGAMGSI